MKYSRNTTNLKFNPASSTIMHIDLNSCFATIEQQANPLLRGKPVAVAAYTTSSGCIVAPSIEAKRYGIKVGMRVKDGKALCPDLIVLPPDPWKYRNVHLKLRKLISSYTNDFVPKSIGEFVLDLGNHTYKGSTLVCLAREMKRRIKIEIGEWLTVSIGIAPNRYLAKVAAGLNKPDGLDEINGSNFSDTYQSLQLTDLTGIKVRNAARLNSVGIYTVLDFFNAPLWKLKAAFASIMGYYWYLRLRGWEIDDVAFGRRSYGNSYALPKPLKTPEELAPILSKLVTKMGARLRRAGYKAQGIHIGVSYRDWDFWHKGRKFNKVFFDSRDIYKEAFKILCSAPHKKPVRELSVSTFNLLKSETSQLELFDDVVKKENLTKSIDEANERWGDFVVTPARMLAVGDGVPDRIAFGAAGSDEPLARRGVKELEEFTLRDEENWNNEGNWGD